MRKIFLPRLISAYPATPPVLSAIIQMIHSNARNVIQMTLSTLCISHRVTSATRTLLGCAKTIVLIRIINYGLFPKISSTVVAAALTAGLALMHLPATTAWRTIT